MNVPLTVSNTGIVFHAPIAESREILPRDVEMTDVNPSSIASSSTALALRTVNNAIAQLSGVGTRRATGSQAPTLLTPNVVRAETRRAELRRRMVLQVQSNSTVSPGQGSTQIFSTDGDRLTEDPETYGEELE